MFKKGDIVKVVYHHEPQAALNVLAPTGTVGIVMDSSEKSRPQNRVEWFAHVYYERGMYDQELEKIGEADVREG